MLEIYQKKKKEKEIYHISVICPFNVSFKSSLSKKRKLKSSLFSLTLEEVEFSVSFFRTGRETEVERGQLSWGI